MTRPEKLLPVALVLLVGCVGTLRGAEEVDAGAPGTDAGPTPNDAGPSFPDADAAREDAGPDPDAGSRDAGVDAGFDAAHDAGSDAGYDAGPPSACGIGYVGEPGACTPIVTDPAARSEAEVCATWRRGTSETVGPSFWQSTGGCDPGTLGAAAHVDTLERVNLYRWLAGLRPATHDDSQRAAYQECAKMMQANGELDHHPPDTWDCYTAGGASAAGSSNLALGGLTPGSAIDLFMVDANVSSLGHRRWVLAHGLGRIQIGATNRSMCLGVFSGGNTTERTWTAYPNEGVAPIELSRGRWSLQMAGASFGDATTVTITRVADGYQPTLEVYAISTGFSRWPALGWYAIRDPDAGPIGGTWRPTAGESYTISVAGHGSSSHADPFEYEVTFADCAS